MKDEMTDDEYKDIGNKIYDILNEYSPRIALIAFEGIFISLIISLKTSKDAKKKIFDTLWLHMKEMFDKENEG